MDRDSTVAAIWALVAIIAGIIAAVVVLVILAAVVIASWAALADLITSRRRRT